MDKVEHYLQDIIQGVSRTYGRDFFREVTIQLDKVIQSDYTFIARLNIQDSSAETVALVAHGELVENFEYALKDTPCKDVSDDSVCIYKEKVCLAFPDDQLLVDMNIEGYVGTPLHDSTGKVMGIVVALYEQPIQDEQITQTLFQIFSGRIAGEFERLDREQALIELNDTLDIKVNERTDALKQTINKLQQAQQSLIETEKMAALGDLVSGVAHEVNTPLGVAITAQSHLEESFKLFKQKLDGKGITLADMEVFVSANEQALPLIERNLERAKELVDNFKKMATEQSQFKSEQLKLCHYYQRLMSTLTPLLKRKHVQYSLECQDEDSVLTYPGCHAQLLTNLVSNSVQHAFKDDSASCLNQIRIVFSRRDDHLVVDYLDNGCGIETDMLSKVIEPFYTTSRIKGNSGLGLSIAFNLVKNNLKGQFRCLPSANGVHIQYEFCGLDC